MDHVTDAARRRRLAERHLLTPSRRRTDVATVADAVVALHSSDPTSVFLSLAARLRAPSVDSIATALYDDRVVLRHHAMRRTIWVMTPDVARHANAGFTRRIAVAERRRTAVLFGEDEAWVADAVERVTSAVTASGGPITTREIAARLPDLAVPRVVRVGASGSASMPPHTRALLLAAFEGRIARGRPAGSWIGSQYEWWPAPAWHAVDWSTPDADTGATDIVARYLDRFGPVTLDDIAWWTGGTKTLVRRALGGAGAVEVGLDDGTTGWALPTDDAAEPDDPRPWVALLPGLDPTAMGWKRREWYLGRDIARMVTDRNGNIGPTVWVDGEILGGWVQRPDGTIAHDATPPTDEHARLLDAEIERLREFVGPTRFSVRFPAPNQRELLG